MSYAMLQDGVVIVRLTDSFNKKVTLQVEKETDEFLNMGQKRFLFDFNQTEYMDSTGLGKLIELREKLQEINGELTLKDVYGYCFGLFELNNLLNDFIFLNEGQNEGIL